MLSLVVCLPSEIRKGDRIMVSGWPGTPRVRLVSEAHYDAELDFLRVQLYYYGPHSDPDEIREWHPGGTYLVLREA